MEDCLDTLATMVDKDITTISVMLVMLPPIKREVIPQNCRTILDITRTAREAKHSTRNPHFQNCLLYKSGIRAHHPVVHYSSTV